MFCAKREEDISKERDGLQTDRCFGLDSFLPVEPKCERIFIGHFDFFQFASRDVLCFTKSSKMYIRSLLILVGFAIANIIQSENEPNSFSTDTGSDPQISENNELTLPVWDQSLDAFNGNSNQNSDFDFNDDNDADATTEFNTQTVAGIPCLLDNQPSGKLRARNDACTPRQFTDGIDQPEGGSKRPSTPKPVPDDTMREFNKRPLGRGEDTHDMCERFMDGWLTTPVCSSGKKSDEKIAKFTHEHIPRNLLVELRNCYPRTFIDLLLSPLLNLLTLEKKLFESDT